MSVSEAKDNIIGKTDFKPSTMEITSEAVYPIIVNENRARFKLKNTGILSKHSCISLEVGSILSSSTITSHLSPDPCVFLPFGAGIYSALKSARLSVGGIVVDEMQNPAYYKTMTHSYNTPDYRRNVDAILLGINSTMQNLVSSTLKDGIGKFTIDNCEPDYILGSRNMQDARSRAIYRLDPALRIRPPGDVRNRQNTIRLLELFNILQTIELPLFLMEKEVVIDLEFNSQLLKESGGSQASGADNIEQYGKILCGVSDTNNMRLLAPNIGAEIVSSSVVLYQDTIYYENERMEQVAKSVNAKEGLFLDYTTFIPNIADHTPESGQSQISANGTMLTTSKTDLIPVANYRIKNMLMAYTSDNIAPLNLIHQTQTPSVNGPFIKGSQFYGKYALYNKFNDPTEVSVRVNDKLIFNEPIKSMTQKAHETALVYGSRLNLNHGLYSSNGMVKDQTVFFGSDLNNYVAPANNLFPDGLDFTLNNEFIESTHVSSLVGACSFMGINLGQTLGDDNDDTILVSKPISVTHTENFDTVNCFSDLKVRYFTEIVQRFGVKDGMVSILRGMPVNVPVR